MKLSFSPEDERFREEVATWLAENLCGEFEPIRFRGGPGDEHSFVEERKAWEQKLAEGGWTCIGWPKQYGGRGASVEQQVVFNEEYARAGGPGRMGHIGETLTGPTLIAFGSDAQKERYLPGIRAGREFWCQGYSEPSAGSDLANVKTRARLDESSGQWVVNGQKVWT
ncbi:MAG: acyl-CoA dehydrogenase family protein, partial [Haliea sp.]|nr:acyl-CoA dehydrogenase family protein [Haliea sp.]